MKKIDIETWNRKSAFLYFKTFSNPCYGFDVEMDITKLYKLTKERKDSFFINMLYIVVMGLDSIEEMRTRYVNGEVVVYDEINPTYCVMTDGGIFENCGHKHTSDYKEFYKRAYEEVESHKHILKVKDSYNDDVETYADYYITCIPWLKYAHMSHPMPDNQHSNSSVPRICWGKYYFDGDKVKIMLNITVSHMLVDGYPLSKTFLSIQNMLDNVEQYIK